jgi:hypothetical protein
VGGLAALVFALASTNFYTPRIIGFTSVYSQQVASLALARRIKERWPDKIVAFGGANCQEEMGRALLRLFPFVDWVFNGQADLSFPEAVARWSAGEWPEGVSGAFPARPLFCAGLYRI